MRLKALLLTSLSAIAMAAVDYPLGKADKIIIDGMLDEPAWQNARAITDFTLLQASGKTTPSDKTEAKMLIDNDAIYFGFKCYGVSGLKADLVGEVTNAWDNDLMEIFIAPTASRDEYYQFALTAGGAYWCQYFAEAGNITPDPYKPSFMVKTSRITDAYLIEARIPFHAFYMTNAEKTANVWALNIARHSTKKGKRPMEESSWAKMNATFHETKLFNTVSGVPAKPARYDMKIPAVTFATTSSSDKGISGTMNIEIVLESAPAGKYTLETHGKKIPVTLNQGANNVKVQTSFMKDGRIPVHFALTNDKNEITCERTFPVLVDATAMAIHFTVPQYAGNFYPGEDARYLKGYVQVNTGAKQVVMKVAGKEYKLNVADSRAPFEIKVADIKGDIQVSVDSVSTVVKHVNDARAWIHDGKIVVAGKPELMLGWYGGNGWITSKCVEEKYPTQSAKHPITSKGNINLETSRLVTSCNIEKLEMVFDRKPSQMVFDATKAAMDKNADSEKYVYYLVDEPECRGLSPIYLKYLYDFIKKNDPTRLVMIISRAPARYIDCCDIINPHPYISPSVMPSGERKLNCTIPRLRDMCAVVENLNRPDKALMLTPQVHSYSFNDIFADYPTFDETVISIWSSIVHGGQGITPYIWYDHMARPSVNIGCDFIYNSLFQLRDYITSANQSRLPGDEGRLFINGKKSMYLICNVYNEPKEFTFETKCKKLYRFRSNEILSPVKGKVTLKMQPYGVIILTSENENGTLESEEAVRAALQKAEYARTHRGNILYGKARTIEVSFPPSRPYDRQNAMEQQDKMFDGNIEVDAWEPQSLTSKTAWYEYDFTDEVPEFSKARIYGFNHQDLEFRIWKFGKWIVPEAKRTNDGKYGLELDFGKTLRTVKIHLEFKNKEVELYEFELLK